MAADQLDSSARVGSALIPSLHDAKCQATKIYEALDAKGYGIIKRQQLAEALPDNKVRAQLFLAITLHIPAALPHTASAKCSS